MIEPGRSQVEMPAMSRSFESAAGEVRVYETATAACREAAERIARVVSDHQGRAVLGLATGNTPIRVYERLLELHRAGELTFRDVTTFNLDEYYPISPFDPNSYRFYMHRHLFGSVDLPPNQAHVLDGTVPETAAAAHCADFDRWVDEAGGLDLQLLGLGRNGHIGFNEPSDIGVDAALRLPTRPVELHPITAEDAAQDFDGRLDLVPRRALTMGTRTILAARTVLVLAFGARKAPAVAAAMSGPITSELPGSLLQTVRERVVWLVDEAAVSG
jgi:glucosamine-6-phosphate deaminase